MMTEIFGLRRGFDRRVVSESWFAFRCVNAEPGLMRSPQNRPRGAQSDARPTPSTGEALSAMGRRVEDPSKRQQQRFEIHAMERFHGGRALCPRTAPRLLPSWLLRSPFSAA